MNWFKRKKPIDVLSPLEGYDRWASSYELESNPIKNLSDELVENFLPDLNGKTILDCGCGTGKFCSIGEKQKATRIVGIDLSPSMIEVASRLCSSTEFRCGDISKIEFEEDSYDVVICALMLAHLEDINSALTSIVKSLKRGGLFIITDFHPYLTLAGSKRTFYDEQSGRRFEVRHYLHLFEEYFSFFNDHNLVIETMKEPKFNNAPAIFGMRVRKQ